MLISSCILLQDPGRLLRHFLVHPTYLNLPPILSAGTKSMLWTFLLTNWNLFPLSQWTALITSRDSCISGLAAHHTRRPVLTVSHLLHHLLLPPILLVKATFRISTFPLLPSSTTRLSLSLGSMRWSTSNSFVDDVIEVELIMYTGLPPLPVALHPPSVPPISSIVTGIIASLDQLFFVSHSLGNPSIWK
jgi:hypothetical protein